MEVQTVSVFSCFLTLFFGTFALDIKPREKCYPTASNETIYDFTLSNVYQNETLDLSQYRGKLVLLVITATYCGAIGQLWGLNDLQDQHGNEGLQVVAVPTNQFYYVSNYCHFRCSLEFSWVVNTSSPPSTLMRYMLI